MRKNLLITTALGACLGLLAFGANATPINLVPASGSSSYTALLGANGSVNLTGWEFDSSTWTAASMVYKNGGPGETGLGVICNTSGDKCNQHEIGSKPWQMIDVNISSLKNYSTLTIGVGSVNGGAGGAPETAFLFGANCTPNSCAATSLGSYTFTGGVDTHSFDLTKAELASFSNIWVTPFFGGTNVDGNILLASMVFAPTTSVPEPAVLGMFGLGVLMIGLLVGLRRRMH